MARFLVTKTKTYLQFYELKRNAKEMVSAKNRFYRCDEPLMNYNIDRSDEMVIYDLESTQPYGFGEYLDTDDTFAMLDSYADGGYKVSKLGSLFGGGNVWQLMTGGAIAIAILYGFLSTFL